ncbi:NAD(P)/FAD-dependent oxidoreductase [Candidatus Korarchaeum cryptofilum]|jgi:NADPH-dependent 2,4-dienoyl-CoA reductase/sulfur reductase-like enzyme|nr:FAD-dependent oxidoreductase [Candidatus Korarchaeum cryptofilum]
MQARDIIIVGGSASGFTAALAARVLYKEKSILLLKKEDKTLIPCGIPYLAATIESCDKNLMPYSLLTSQGVEVVIDEVVDIDRNSKIVITASGNSYKYEKLILATGSLPFIPPSIEGTNLKNVFLVYKRYEEIEALKKALRDANKIVIIGGGFIGVELADDLSNIEKDVTIVEMLPHCLLQNMDEEFAIKAEEELRKRGIKIITDKTVKRIYGKERAEGVELEDGEKIPADVVVISTGYRPNVELAKKIGLRIGDYGVLVDEFMRTSDLDIFAVGDIAEKKFFLTGKPAPVLLASAACQEARVAVANLYGAKVGRKVSGQIGVFSTKIGDLTLACAGITESLAKKENIEYIVGRAKVANRHPANLPGATEIELKLIFLRDETLIGAQASGRCNEVAELINAIAIAIQNKMKIGEIITMSYGTHPKLTASPVMYPVVVAALDAYRQL